MEMDLETLNQKLNKILEYQEQQVRYAKIRFWINLILIVVFVILPLILLPTVINNFMEIYSSSFNLDNLENTQEQAKGLLDLF